MTYSFKLPDIGEGVAEGEIVRWLVAEGDMVTEDQPMLEVMTDKVTVEIPSPIPGKVIERRYNEGAIVEVGSVIVVLADDTAENLSVEVKETNATPVLESAKAIEASPSFCQTTDILAAPATRKLARSLGVSLSAVQGTGERGRITPFDVEKAANKTAVAISEKPKVKKLLVDKKIPYKGMRKVIGDRLSKSKQTIPHFVLAEEVNVTALVHLRQDLKPLAEQENLKLSVLPFVLKAVVIALLEFPAFNSELKLSESEIIQYSDVQLGVAVETDDGLAVPVISQAELLTVKQLAQSVQTLSQKARNGQLTRQEATGSTFTVTSIGNIGGVMGIPIVNPPEVAILAVNRIRKQPIVNERDEIVVGHTLMLTLSADHRVVDGGEAARFLTKIKSLLEKPALLLWESP